MDQEASSHSWQDLFRAVAIEWLLLCSLALLVSLVITALRHFEAVQSLDRSVSDIVMRELARERLESPQPQGNRYIFINIGEATCRLWAADSGGACSSGFAAPRDRLTAILQKLADTNKGRKPMKLVLLDVELATTAKPKEEPATDEQKETQPPEADKSKENLAKTDKDLCVAAYSIAKTVPVLAVRPLVPEARAPGRPSAMSYASIFDDKCGDGGDRPDVWFASPLLQPDPDNVVRSVYAWHQTVTSASTSSRRIAGFGLLGAALADGKVDRNLLACLFPASHEPSGPCATKHFSLGQQDYEPSDADPNKDWLTKRILFSLPSDPGAAAAADFNFAPFVFQTLEAYELLLDRDKSPSLLDQNPSLLDGAIVVIGGSYAASGDLHATPLGPRMPGAMVHANAIRAIAAGTMVDESEGWGWELLLVAIASTIGAVFHVAGHLAYERVRSPLNHIAKLGLAVISIIVTVLVIFAVGTLHAFASLAQAGTAIAVISPVIAVAFEGMSSILQVVRDALSSALTWAQTLRTNEHLAQDGD